MWRIYVFRQEAEIGNVKVQRNNVNKFVLDTVIELVGKVETRPRWTWIAQKVVNKG
jgi:hypothetical protein